MPGHGSLKVVTRLVPAAVAVVVLLASGCSRSGTSRGRDSTPGPARSASEEPVSTPPPASTRPPASVRQAADRTALAASLGWGQVSRGNETRPQVALTFDCGADAAWAQPILDALSSAGVHSTFFVTGQFAHGYPDVVRRIVADGHELGNHSYSHPRFTDIPLAEALSEIARTEQEVASLTGLSTKPYFRFPYGAGSSELVSAINAEGYIGVLWTFDTLDWETDTTADEIRGRVSARACPGAIILMHIGSPQEAAALPSVISELRAAGYRPVTLTEALGP